MSDWRKYLSYNFDDMNNLTERELRKAVSSMRDIANARARRLRKSDVSMPSALRPFEQSGGDITVTGKSINQLRKEFTRAVKFLNAKTSTVTGARRVQRETEKRLGIPHGTFTNEQWSVYWETYDRIRNNEDTLVTTYMLGSDRLQEMIRDEMISGRSADNIVENAVELAQKFDEERDETAEWVDEDFFSFFENM